MKFVIPKEYLYPKELIWMTVATRMMEIPVYVMIVHLLPVAIITFQKGEFLGFDNISHFDAQEVVPFYWLRCQAICNFLNLVFFFTLMCFDVSRLVASWYGVITNLAWLIGSIYVASISYILFGVYYMIIALPAYGYSICMALNYIRRIRNNLELNLSSSMPYNYLPVLWQAFILATDVAGAPLGVSRKQGVCLGSLSTICFKCSCAKKSDTVV